MENIEKILTSIDKSLKSIAKSLSDENKREKEEMKKEKESLEKIVSEVLEYLDKNENATEQEIISSLSE